MTFLDTAKDFILDNNTALSGGKTKAADSLTKSGHKLSSAIINPTENEGNMASGDIYAPKTKLDEKIEIKFSELKNKCEALGLDYEKTKTALLNKANYNNAKNDKERIFILESINHSLDYVKKQGIAIDENSIGQLVAVSSKASKLGIDYNEYQKYKINSVNTYSEYKKAKTSKEQQSVLHKAGKSNRQINESARQAELKTCKDSNEIERVNKKYDDLNQIAEIQSGIELSMAIGPKDAKNVAYIFSADNQAEGQRAIIETFEGEEREQVANSFTHEFEMKLLEDYYNYGEQISAQEYEEIVNGITQYKSEDAISQYQADAQRYAQEHEDSPWYTNEYKEAEIRGITSGIQANSNIGKNSNAESSTLVISHSSDYTPVQNNSSATDVSAVKNDNVSLNKSEKPNNIALPHTPCYGTAKDLENAFINYEYSDVRSAYTNSTEEIMQLIAQSDKLYHLREHLLDYKNTCSMQEFCYTIQSPNKKIEHYLFRTFSPEDSGKYFEFSKNNMCYNERKYSERVLNQRKTDISAS